MIREIPAPQNVKELWSFWGLASYHCRYVKRFAAIASPLHALMKKEAVFHWTPECQDTFLQLKHPFTTVPITAFPNFDLPFRLYTDASTLCLGAIIAQVQEWQEQIICCTSYPLSQTETYYPAIKLECLAIVWATVKLCPYLMLNKFDVYNDHYALQWLKFMRIGSALLHCWPAALEEFDFMIHHQPVKAQTLVDGLSQLPIEQAPPDVEEATFIK